MKVGLLGGSFDPIHLGHLRAAENAREALKLDLVLFIPAANPPHKPEGTLSSGPDRLAMVILATAGNPAFLASDAELRRSGPSYTADTLASLRGERPADELYLIVGSDTLPEMSTWHDPARIFALCTVAVAGRPGVARAPAPAAARVVELPGPGLDLRATDLRRRVREGRSVRYLVPDAVAEYIAKRGLYA
jgi:nicotinate-nucleotide adenylyltransferase